jgi:tetratricopeptide (TPR) repeat protein
MTTIRRLVALCAVLSLAVVYTCADVWGGNDEKSKQDRRLSTGKSTGRDESNFTEELAASKFAGGGMLTYRTRDGAQLFALQIKPEIGSLPPRPRDYLVMVDTSASQVGQPLATAKRLAEEIAARARDDDRVAIWTVNVPQATLDLTHGFQAPKSEAVHKALQDLKDQVPLGDTDLKAGLERAIKSFGFEPERQRTIVFLGDGMSTHNPITNVERSQLCDDMVKGEIAFFPVPLGPRLDPRNLHGFASGTGGLVVRVLPRDQSADVLARLQKTVVAPILYPSNFQFQNAQVAECYPTRLPPLRADAPTLMIGKLPDVQELRYVIEGLVAGKPVRIAKVERVAAPELDNFFLVGMVEQWKNAKEEPALMQADRALAFAQEINQLARVELLAQAETALAADRLDAAAKLFAQAKNLDPSDAEADGGLKVVEKLREGKITKDQLRAQFGKRDGIGIRIEKAADGKGGVQIRKDRLDHLLAQAEQTPPPPPPAAAPAPPPAPGDLLRQQRQRQVIEEQRITQTVDDAIREARRQLQTDPEGARDSLKRILASVRDDVEISDTIRNALSNRLENTLRNVEIEGARVLREQADRLRLQAIAQERLQQQQARQFIEQTTQARMLVFHNLMDQARFEEAYKQSLAIIQDAINQGHPIPVAVTAAHDISLVADNLREVQELKRVREERFLLTLLQTEKSHVPFPDEPPVVFPPAATWRQLTQLRKERYESSGLTEDDPITLRRIRELEKTLATPVPTVELEPGSLKDALGYLSDRFNIPIVIDSDAFKDLGINDIESQTVKLSRLSNISLATVLRLLLSQVQGTYIIRRDFIEVTTGQRQAAEKVIRVYPVADLVTPIPNAFNQQAINQSIANSILGFQLDLARSLGPVGTFTGFGFSGAGFAGLQGFAGAGGLAGLGQGAFGGFAGIGGLAGNIGGVGGVTGGNVQNLGVGGGGVSGFAGFGGQLGQFGNLGGQFGLQGGDQSQILIRLITQVVGTPRDWAPPGVLQRLTTGGVQGTSVGNTADDEPAGDPETGGQLGYFPPARALIVKATSRIHTRLGGGPTSSQRNAPPPGGGAAKLDNANADEPIVKADDRFKERRRKDSQLPRGPGSTADPSTSDPGTIAKANPKDRKDSIGRNSSGKDLEPRKIWQEALAKGVNDPGLIIACADFLFERKQFEHAAEFLKANLRLGIVARPWVYEALTVALKECKGSSVDIERAELSAVDLEPQDTQGYLRASHAMADAKHYDRALAFCRQASILEPNASQPYADALLYAELAKDSDAMEWATSNLLGRDWPINDRELHDKARDRLRTLCRLLKDEKRQAEAERMAATAERIRARDLVIHLSWQGEADLDLEVKEPIGTLCSFMHRQTPGGGTLIGDTLDDLSNETYTAAQAFAGSYEITVRRIWGRPLGSKASLEIIRNQGTPEEQRTRTTFVFDRTHTLTVDLKEGRRKEVAQVPPSSSVQRPKAVSVASSDRVLNKLRALADPDLAVSDGGMRGGVSSSGAAAQSGIKGPENFTAESYAGAVKSLVNGGMDLTAQAALSQDRRFVRVSLAPVFQTIGQTQSVSLVANPVIPGGP